MPLSAIDRISNNSGHNGVFTGPVVNQTLPNRRNEMMQRISRNASRLRPAPIANGVIEGSKYGRKDSLEQLLVRLGVIPIVTFPNPTSLTGTIQCYPAQRPYGGEGVSVVGGTAPAAWSGNDSYRAVPFTAGGNNQLCTATDSVDANAKGRALINILP